MPSNELSCHWSRTVSTRGKEGGREERREGGREVGSVGRGSEGGSKER